MNTPFLWSNLIFLLHTGHTSGFLEKYQANHIRAINKPSPKIGSVINEIIITTMKSIAGKLFLSSTIWLLHLGQAILDARGRFVSMTRVSKLWPHLLQNLLPSGFSVPHSLQYILSPTDFINYAFMVLLKYNFMWHIYIFIIIIILELLI